MKKIIIGIIVLVLIGLIAFVWFRQEDMGPGQSSAAWNDDVAVLNPDMFPDEDLDIYLNEQRSWGEEIREAFWHIDQGSIMVPFDIFTHLYVKEEDAYFIGVENMTRLGYVSRPPTEQDPRPLPIGFTKTEHEWNGQTYAGLNCAACHSGLIKSDGNVFFMNGAPTHADFQAMTVSLSEALSHAFEDNAAFDALASRMGVTDKPALRDRLKAAADAMAARIALNETPSVYGPARVDAVGEIYNSVSSVNLNLPQNQSPPSAPVSYPFIWGTGQSDMVQWTGFAPNDVPGGMLIRNTGEVLGVFGQIEVPPQGDKDWFEIGYKSSVNLPNLGKIESWVNTLEPPAWPGEQLGEPDPTLVAEGEKLFQSYCAECHQVVTPYETYKAELSPVVTIDTDPGNAATTLQFGANRSGDAEAKLKILIKQAVGAILHDPIDSIDSVLEEVVIEKFGAQGTYTYKGRPLNGIWATAPYLHNGSVPTLDDLLKPVADRPVQFTFGGWEFDKDKVGVAEYDGEHGFTFDTTLPGNSNAGHVYGPEDRAFSAKERKALVAYMKGL